MTHYDEIPLEDQVEWLRDAVARDRAYWQRRAAENRTHPSYAARRIRTAEAALRTLERVTSGDWSSGGR